MAGRQKLIVVALSVLAIAIVLIAGELLSRPAQHAVGAPPTTLAAKSVTLTAAPNLRIAGWVVNGQPGAGVVLLLHGVRADRRVMLGRAEFLASLGYSLLLIDLPAHGESLADHITYGINESEAVRASLGFMSANFPEEKIGVIGVSLGAAAMVLAKPNSPPAAVVLEAMFATIHLAVSNRISATLGAWADPLLPVIAPLLLLQLPLRLGITPEQLRPIESLPHLGAPVLIASGSIDRYTPQLETEQLYQAAAAPKELWIVQGAAHVDLHAFDPAAYESKVGGFLAKHLRTSL